MQIVLYHHHHCFVYAQTQSKILKCCAFENFDILRICSYCRVVRYFRVYFSVKTSKCFMQISKRNWKNCNDPLVMARRVTSVLSLPLWKWYSRYHWMLMLHVVKMLHLKWNVPQSPFILRKFFKKCVNSIVWFKYYKTLTIKKAISSYVKLTYCAM